MKKRNLLLWGFLTVAMCSAAGRDSRKFFAFDNGLKDIQSLEEQALLLRSLFFSF